MDKVKQVKVTRAHVWVQSASGKIRWCERCGYDYAVVQNMGPKSCTPTRLPGF